MPVVMGPGVRRDDVVGGEKLCPMMTLSCSDATTWLPSPNSYPTGNCMRSFSTARCFLGIALFSILCGPQQATAQPAAALPKPIATPAKPPVALAPRGGAACHNGITLDRLPPPLKQQPAAAAPPQTAPAEPPPR